MEKAVNNNFRFEKKILVNSHLYKDLIYLFKSKGFKSLYPSRNICNLYLDDFNFTSYQDNVLGNCNRLKHRIRWYGELFKRVNKLKLEQKIKKGNVGKKNKFEINKSFILDKKYNLNELKKLIKNLLSHLEMLEMF